MIEKIKTRKRYVMTIKENLTVPNFLSLSRIVLLPILYVFALKEMRLAFTIAFVIIASTDWFDGQIARRFNQKSPLGTELDSIADIFFVFSTAFFIYRLYPQYLEPNRVLMIVGISIVAVSFLLSGILFKKPVMMHTTVMRLPTVLLFIFLILSYSFDTTYFLGAILIVYMVGFLEEIVIFLKYGLVDPDSKSIFQIKYLDDNK